MTSENAPPGVPQATESASENTDLAVCGEHITIRPTGDVVFCVQPPGHTATDPYHNGGNGTTWRGPLPPLLYRPRRYRSRQDTSYVVEAMQLPNADRYEDYGFQSYDAACAAWETAAAWCGSEIRNSTGGVPGDEPTSYIPVGKDHAYDTDWIIRAPNADPFQVLDDERFTAGFKPAPQREVSQHRTWYPITAERVLQLADKIAPVPATRAASRGAWARHYAALGLACSAAFRHELDAPSRGRRQFDLGLLIGMGTAATAAAVALSEHNDVTGRLWALTPEVGALNGEWEDWLIEYLDTHGVNPADLNPWCDPADFNSPSRAQEFLTIEAPTRSVKRQPTQAEVERDWLLAEASDEVRRRFFAARADEATPSRPPRDNLQRPYRFVGGMWNGQIRKEPRALVPQHCMPGDGVKTRTVWASADAWPDAERYVPDGTDEDGDTVLMVWRHTTPNEVAAAHEHRAERYADMDWENDGEVSK